MVASQHFVKVVEIVFGQFEILIIPTLISETINK